MVRKIMETIFCLLKLAKTILSVMLGAGIGNEIYKIWKAEE